MFVSLVFRISIDVFLGVLLRFSVLGCVDFVVKLSDVIVWYMVFVLVVLLI